MNYLELPDAMEDYHLESDIILWSVFDRKTEGVGYKLCGRFILSLDQERDLVPHPKAELLIHQLIEKATAAPHGLR